MSGLARASCIQHLAYSIQVHAEACGVQVASFMFVQGLTAPSRMAGAITSCGWASALSEALSELESRASALLCTVLSCGIATTAASAAS